MSRGWWGEQVMTDPVDGVAKLVQLGSTRRLRVIFQTNMATAFAAGQWARIQSNKKALPYLRYNKSAAGQPRDSHRRYYGFRVGNEEAAIILKERKKFPDMAPTLWIEVEDVRAKYAVLQGRNIHFLGEPFRIRTGMGSGICRSVRQSVGVG